MHTSANEFLTLSLSTTTFIPKFVNMAFACELYLKIILQKNNKHGKPIKEYTHDLQRLYNKAVAYFDEDEFLRIFAQKRLDCFYILPTDTKPKLNYNATSTKFDLKKLLKRHRNLFKELRYNFKRDNLSINGDLRAFALALEDYVGGTVK